MSSPLFVGLDIETTGLDLHKDHRLIQLGVVVPRPLDGILVQEIIVRDVLPMGTTVLEAQAMEVNGFTLARIQGGTPNDEVDAELYELFADRGVEERSLIATGFNVGGFDLAFLNRELPRFAKFFSHRTMDLASVCFLLGELEGRDWREIKDEVRAETTSLMGVPKWHDAGFDAAAALVTFEVLKRRIRTHHRPGGLDAGGV